MGNIEMTSEKIIERLKFFNYKYKQDGNSLRIYLPLYCSLKINFDEDNVTINPDLTKSLNLSCNTFAILIFFILAIGTAIILQVDIWHNIKREYGAALITIFPLAFILKLIVAENMRTIVHNWIEK